MLNERFGHILVRWGLIDAEKLDFCLSVQKNTNGERIGRVLRHYDFISEEDIARALAEQAGWEIYHGNYTPDEYMVSLLGIPFLLEKLCLPVCVDGEAVFVFCCTDDMSAIDYVRSRINGPVRFGVASETYLRLALERLAIRQRNTGIHEAGDANDCLAWLEHHLNKAIARGATDVHIECSQKAVEIRFRMDGILYFIDAMALSNLSRLANVIFHKANVTVSDFGHLHDARFTHRYLNRDVDIRVSHIPCVHGSSLVLRLLDKNKTSIGLAALGFDDKNLELIRSKLNKPEGIVLIIGPTGCGKTTTLYAILNHLKSLSRKIISIEDPVEMHASLVTQVQVSNKREITFANAVRAFLRHDPNVILIGEIRDAETAREAVRAAMTGHQVFATVHANRPADAILRLNDLGIPYAHLTGNLSMIIAQRLLRRLCRACKGRGCDQCTHGFKGRMAVAEILVTDDEVESLIGEGDVMGLKKHLKQSGRKTMRDDADRLVREGMTSVEEIVRVLG